MAPVSFPALAATTTVLVREFVDRDPVGLVCDVAGLAALFCGALLCLSSAIGLTRLDELYARMHAATKPQVLGTLLVLLGIGLRLREPSVLGLLVLVGIFQMLTIPASAQLLARAHLRTRGPRDEIASGGARVATLTDSRDMRPAEGRHHEGGARD